MGWALQDLTPLGGGLLMVTGGEKCQADTFYANPPRVNIAVLFLRDFLASGTSVVKYRDAILTLMPSK